MALGSSAKAALWMVGAIASFTAMAVAGREMASELDTFEIMRSNKKKASRTVSRLTVTLIGLLV